MTTITNLNDGMHTIIMMRKVESLTTAGYHRGWEFYGTQIVCRLIGKDFQKIEGPEITASPKLLFSEMDKKDAAGRNTTLLKINLFSSMKLKV